MRFLTTRCPGWGAALLPPGGALGIAGGGQGGGQLSPFPISPGITYRKKTGEGKLEMFTKHTSHSTVNPLDAKQTHQEPLPPRAPGGSGVVAPTASSCFPWFLWFGFFFDTIPAASIRAHLPGACFPGGFASCPLPGSSCSAGSWGKRLSLLGEVLARWEMLALTPCPPRCTLRPNFPFFPSLGLAEGRQGMLPWPQGLQDLSHGCADSGPLALPMWESPLETLEMPMLP